MSQKKMMSTMKRMVYRLSLGLRWSKLPEATVRFSSIMWIVSLGRVSKSHLEGQLRADAGMFPTSVGNWMKTNQILRAAQ